MSWPPLHLVITYSMRYAQDLMSEAQAAGKLVSRTTRYDGVLADGTHIRCISCDREIRGYQPVSHQIVWAPDRTYQQRHRIDEIKWYLSIRKSEEKEII